GAGRGADHPGLRRDPARGSGRRQRRRGARYARRLLRGPRAGRGDLQPPAAGHVGDPLPAQAPGAGTARRGVSSRFPFLDWPYPIPFAHRGGAAEVGGENTLAAFGRALSMGYRYLETDGRVTSDGVLLAFHDERLDRVTDLTGRLEDRPWSEVRQAKVGAEGEPITTMEGLLDAFPDARFNIDPKMDAAVAPLAEALRRTNAFDRVNIAAFSDRRLLMLRRALARPVCTSMGPAAIGRLRLAGYGVPVGPFAAA